MFYTIYASKLFGPVTIAADEKGIAGLWLEGQKYFAASAGKREEWKENDDFPALCKAKEWLDRYFAKERPEIKELPLAPKGSAFRQEVWRLLCEIPYGEVTTYGELAKKIAEKQKKRTMSAQAVGGAVGHNPISIIIPCHRVVGAKGNLTGYAGGIDKKIKLLELEGLTMSDFTIPRRGTAL